MQYTKYNQTDTVNTACEPATIPNSGKIDRMRNSLLIDARDPG